MLLLRLLVSTLFLAILAGPAAAQSTPKPPAPKAKPAAQQPAPRPETDADRFQRQRRLEEHERAERFPAKPLPKPAAKAK